MAVVLLFLTGALPGDKWESTAECLHLKLDQEAAEQARPAGYRLYHPLQRCFGRRGKGDGKVSCGEAGMSSVEQTICSHSYGRRVESVRRVGDRSSSVGSPLRASFVEGKLGFPGRGG